MVLEALLMVFLFWGRVGGPINSNPEAYVRVHHPQQLSRGLFPNPVLTEPTHNFPVKPSEILSLS